MTSDNTQVRVVTGKHLVAFEARPRGKNLGVVPVEQVLIVLETRVEDDPNYARVLSPTLGVVDMDRNMVRDYTRKVDL